jgi:hypothetical protein
MKKYFELLKTFKRKNYTDQHYLLPTVTSRVILCFTIIIFWKVRTTVLDHNLHQQWFLLQLVEFQFNKLEADNTIEFKTSSVFLVLIVNIILQYWTRKALLSKLLVASLKINRIAVSEKHLKSTLIEVLSVSFS